MKELLFSIIIPSYNSASYIRRCLDSLIHQTYPLWEAIVIDNQSTDNTASIIKSYEDNRIQYHLINNDGVIAKSRNYGIALSKGQFICFLDSDDWWKKDKLESCLSFTNQDAPVLIYHQFELYRADQVKWHTNVSQYRALPEKERIKNLLCKGNTIGTSSVCLSRSILNRCLFDENPNLAGVEDFDLWIRILSDDTVRTVFIDKPLAYYYVGSTFSSSAKQIIRLRYLIAKYIDQFDKQSRREIIKSWYFNKAIYYYSNFIFSEATKYFLISSTSKDRRIRSLSIKSIIKCKFLSIYNILK